MNKEDILKEINKTREHLARLGKLLEECVYERWKPDENETYFIVDSKGILNCHNMSSTTSKLHFDFYNCFQTREQAEAEAEKILVRRQLEDIARRLNRGRKIDWDDENQQKYFICYNKNGFNSGYNLEESWGSVYCLDKNFKDIAIEIIGEKRLKKYLRGE